MTSVPQTEPSRPDESPPALSGALVTAMVLAAVAGFLDAHLFLNVTEVFVANQSGNVVLLGMYLGEGNWISAAGSAVALGAFAVGVMVATALHVKRRARGLQLRPDIMLGVESVLLVALALVLAFWHPDREPTPTPGHLPLLALGGLAMGLQTTVLGKVGSTAVATTYESGSVVRVSEQAVLGSWTDDVEARPVWKPMHLQPVYADAEVIGGAVATDLFERGLCLPSGSAMTDEDVARVVRGVRAVWERSGAVAG